MLYMVRFKKQGRLRHLGRGKRRVSWQEQQPSFMCNMVGAILSHAAALKAHGGLDAVLVLEDDCVCDQFSAETFKCFLEDLLQKLPKRWECVQLGATTAGVASITRRLWRYFAQWIWYARGRAVLRSARVCGAWAECHRSVARAIGSAWITSQCRGSVFARRKVQGVASQCSALQGKQSKPTCQAATNN